MAIPSRRYSDHEDSMEFNGVDFDSMEFGAVPGSPKRRSFRRVMKDKGSSAKKWITSRLSEISKTSNCSDDDVVHLDFDMEEETRQDLDLFELIQHKPWDSDERAKYDDEIVHWYANNHPKSFRVRYDFDLPDGGKSSHFPLQRIVSLGASLRTIEMVVSTFPPAILYKHHQERSTVLHAACTYPSAFQAGVFQFLLELNPDAANQTNRHAFLPIHNACCASNPSPIGLEAIQILLEANPKSILLKNKLGETPFDAAKQNGESLPDVVSFLEDAYKQQSN